ncbi:MAG: SPFH domain-containing protein, partial [Planctomycetia bacterium]
MQLEVVKEGRAFYNPLDWDWEIHEQREVRDGKLGVLIRLFGDDLPHQDLLAALPTQKGIVPGALTPGRYPEFSNPYAYTVEEHDVVTVPAGYKGVLTLVTGQPAKTANGILVEDGERGVQKKALDPGTYYFNPYEKRVNLVDCRTKLLALQEEGDMGFPSRDGFWVRLDGTIQFHVNPEKAAEVYVLYNDDANGPTIDAEVAHAIIMPNARSFCRLAGSRYTGRQFIEGSAREEFQREFQEKMVKECEPKGIIVDSALITRIVPPEPIADPVRNREIAKQEQAQYKQEMAQQASEAKLVIEKMRITQKKRLIDAEREVIEMKTLAKQEQQVAVTKAEQQFAVAEKLLQAATD